MKQVLHFLEQYMLPCFNKQIFGIPCPGCGLQRSVFSLLQGNFAESFYQYPPLPLIIGTIVVLVFHLTKGSATSLITLKTFYFSTLAIILTNYIINLISH